MSVTAGRRAGGVVAVATQGKDGSNRDFKNRSLDPDDFRGSKALKPEHIAPADTAVVTVADVDQVDLDDRSPIVLHSHEYPDLSIWLNKTGTRTLIEKLGAKPAQWIGERVPLVVVRVNNPQTKQSQKSLQVAPPGEWADIFAAFKRQGAKGKASARKR